MTTLIQKFLPGAVASCAVAIACGTAFAQCPSPTQPNQWLPLFSSVGVQTDRAMDAREPSGLPPAAAIFATIEFDPDGPQGPLPTSVVIGGRFSTFAESASPHVCAWTGSQAIPLDGGLAFDGNVRALAVFNGALYAGGEFSRVGGTRTSRLAVWNGAFWQSIAVGFSGTVTGLVATSTHMYASGDFTFAWGVYAPKLARFDGSAWTHLHDATNNRFVKRVESMAALANGDLVVSGEFSSFGATTPTTAIWNGSTWTDASFSPSTVLRSMQHVGGDTLVAQRVDNSQIVMRTGGAWSALGNLASTPRALSVVNGSIMVHSGTSVLRWNGSSWATFAPAPSGQSSFGIDGFFGMGGALGDVYAHGSGVEWPVGSPLRGVAKWDSASGAWVGLGSGPNKPVRTLHEFGDDLIVGGEFTRIDGQAYGHVAKWRDGAFSPMGAGRPADVLALAMFNGQLVSAGKRPASPMVWNGSAWQNVPGLSDGLFDSTTRAMLVHDGFLHVFGRFPIVNDQFHPLAAFERWAARWEPGNGLVALPTGQPNGPSGNRYGALSGGAFGGQVFSGALDSRGAAMIVYNGELITASDGVLRRWNGSTNTFFAEFSGGVAQSGLPLVNALAVFQDNLYAAGDFTILPNGVSPANRIARYNGSFWSTLGFAGAEGVNDTVHALVVHDNKLFVGGRFIAAGGRASQYLAAWGCPEVPRVCDSIDFNNDGLLPDTLDVEDFISVMQGGACSNDPNCNGLDFNNDGLFPDTLDVEALLSVFAGGPCL